MLSHRNYCVVEDDAPNAVFDNYTASEFNREMNRGNINPHRVQRSHAFKNQLHDIGPIRDMISTDSQDNESSSVQELPPMNVMTDLPDTYQPDESEDEAINEQDLDSENDDDMNLDGQDRDVEEEALLPSMFNDVAYMYETVKSRIPPDTMKPDSKKKPKRHLSWPAIALTHLLLLVNKHGGSKAMFEDLLKYIFSWTKRDPLIFVHEEGMPIWTRDAVLEALQEEFDSSDLKFEKNNVELNDGRTVTIPVIDFAAQARDVLDSPFVRANVAEGIDWETFRPIANAEEHENNPNAIIGEKHTGFLYQRAIDLHCPSAPNVDPTLVRPLVLVLHIDKSHADLFGSLCVTPIQWSLAMIDINGQYNIKAWRVLAYIPNLSKGKGAAKSKKKDSGSLNRQDFHKCLTVALSSLTKYYQAGGIWWKDEHCRDVLLKPIILMSIGDTVGQNELVNHFNNCKATCLGKDCLCDQNRIVQWPSRCRWPLSREIMECENDAAVFDLYESCHICTYKNLSLASNDEVYAKRISKEVIDTAWDRLPLADKYLGMLGMTPQEFLHVTGCGLYKHELISIRDIVGPKDSNAKVKDKIDKCFSDIKFALEHNSERDISRMSNRKGFFNHASLTSEEVRGNFFGMVVMMHTSYGESLFQPAFEKKGIDFEEARLTCLLLLAWERFYLDPQTRQDVEASYEATQRLQQRVFQLIPREERSKDDKNPGSMGWKITKFHVMLYMAGIMLKFGCLKGVDSGPNEKNHKGLFKEHYGRTQKRSSTFASQIACGEYERMLLEKAKLHIERLLPDEVRDVIRQSRYEYSQTTYERQHYDPILDDDDNPVYNVPFDETNAPPECQCSGNYSLVIKLQEDRRRLVSHKWKYAVKNYSDRFSPNPLMSKVLSDYHLKYCQQYSQTHHNELQFECYTAVKYNGVLYRSDPNFMGRGHDWYDWCIARFVNTAAVTNRTVHTSSANGSAGGWKSLARIMGFFRHKQGGVPTFNNVERCDKSWDQITASGTDETVYMVLHCEEDYFKYEALVEKFVHRFTVTDIGEMFILPISSIVGPVAVINDLEDDGRSSNKRFMAVLPRHKQSGFFINYMYSNDPDYEVDMNAVLPEDLEPLVAQLNGNENEEDDTDEDDDNVDEDDSGDEVESLWEEADDHDMVGDAGYLFDE